MDKFNDQVESYMALLYAKLFKKVKIFCKDLVPHEDPHVLAQNVIEALSNNDHWLQDHFKQDSKRYYLMKGIYRNRTDGLVYSMRVEKRLRDDIVKVVKALVNWVSSDVLRYFGEIFTKAMKKFNPDIINLFQCETKSNSCITIILAYYHVWLSQSRLPSSDTIRDLMGLTFSFI